MSTVRQLVPGLVALLLAACASATSSDPSKPARMDPVAGGANGVALKLYIEDSPALQSRTIYARNTGDTPVTVTTLTLYACTNIVQSCTDYTPNVEVPAHRTVKVMELNPRQPKTFYTFGYRYQYHAPPRAVVSSRTFTTRIGGDIGGAPPVGSVQPVMLGDVETFHAVVPSLNEHGTCVHGPNLVGMIFGAPGSAHRMVTIHVDSAGQPTNYSDTRGDLRAPGDSTVARGARTDINITINAGSAMLANSGNGMTPEMFLVRGQSLLTSPALGVPQGVIDQVLRECKGQR